MTLFDLLFLLLVLVSLATLLTAAVKAIRGRRKSALSILRRFGICAAIYVAIVAVVGFFSAQRILEVGDAWCFDDWCLTVEKVGRTPAPPEIAYQVSLRIFSQARRVSQRANGAWIYLIDGRGRKYPPETDPAAVPLDVQLGPGESVNTSRVFKVPSDARELGLITGHGGFCIGWLIIGDSSSLLHKRTYVRLD